MAGQDKKKNDRKSVLLAVALVAAGIVANMASEGSAGEIILVLVVVCFVAAVIIAVAKTAKKAKAEKAEIHSHDRLSNPELAEPCTTGAQHWKKQLDSFLAAGIIDRSEYRVLWNKYKDFYD